MKYKKLKKQIPQNVLVLATHGTAAVPEALKTQLHPNFSTRLQKNFSDFGTNSLVKNLPKCQKISPKFGRIAGDQNRDIDDLDLFRETDFNGNKIWKKPLSEKQKNKFLKDSRQAYLDSVFAKIEDMCQKTDASKPIILLDLHDTGNRLLGVSKDLDKQRSEFFMPKVIFSNQNNKTSQANFLQKIALNFSDSFNLDQSKVKLNEVFLGGFITQFFGGVKKNKRLDKILKKYNRSRDSLMVVQCELDRSLYLDETNQKIRPEIGRIRNNFENFVAQMAA